MNKRSIIFVAIVVLAITAALLYVFTLGGKGKVHEMINQITDSQSSTQKQSFEETEKADVVGRYTDYSSSDFESTAGTRLLFFHAPWCPQCRMLDASIDSSDIPGNVTIFKVDYDTNQKLRQKYGVTIQTTVVKVDSSGDKEELYVAYDEPDFNHVKEALLE